MNRSILIVICDFLVLSAMSLSNGIVQPTAKPVAGYASSAETVSIEKMHSELKKRAALRNEKERVSAELDVAKKDLAKQSARTGAEQGEKERLAAELAAAKEKLAQQASRAVDAQSEKERLAAELAAAKQRLARQAEQVGARLQEQEKNIGQVRREYARMQEKSVLLERQLAGAQNELQQKRDALVRRETEIKNIQGRYTAAVGELKTVSGQARQTEQNLSYTSGKLLTTEKELADRRSKAEDLSKEILLARQESARLAAELENARKMLSQTGSDLTVANRSLEDTRKELALTGRNLAVSQAMLAQTRQTVDNRERDLRFTREQLQRADALLRSDAWTCYSKAAHELSYHLKNERIMNSFDLKKTLYLPEVKINGKNFLVTSFSSITGLDGSISGFTKVVELSYRNRLLASESGAAAVSGPILSLAEDRNICLIPLGKQWGEPLSPISFAGLKKRGLQNLTLFKASTFGQETALLDGRCSLGLNAAAPHYLIIRNAIRNSSELPAEVGDFVISKEGAFVGVVVRVRNDAYGRSQDAFCYLFPETVRWTGAREIPLTKPDAEKLYSGFAGAVNSIQQQLSDAKK